MASDGTAGRKSSEDLSPEARSRPVCPEQCPITHVGVRVDGSPPTEESAHWTMPAFPSPRCAGRRPHLPQEGLGVLGDLGGGSVESRRQENSTNPP